MGVRGGLRDVVGGLILLGAACSKAYQGEGAPGTGLPTRQGSGSGDAAASSGGPDATRSAYEAGEPDSASSGAPEGGTGPVPPPTRSPGRIECGGPTCAAGSSCCLNLSGAPSCGGGGCIFVIRCDEPADCASGEHCCASSNQVACNASCGSDYTVCVSDADCAAGQHCNPAPSPIPAPYRYCE